MSSSDSIARSLVAVSEVYYKRTGRTLQEISINKEIYEALQQELYCELELDELPNNIVLYGMTIRKE